jgi:hypothetical protein
MTHDHVGAIDDARAYRALGLPVHDSTSEDLTTTAESVVDFIRAATDSQV